MSNNKCSQCYFRNQCPDHLEGCPYYTPLTDEQDVSEYIDDCEMRQKECQKDMESESEDEENGDTQPKTKTYLKAAHKIL